MSFFWMALLPLIVLLQPSYSQQTGTLRINLEPADAVSAGAQWRVDSGPWQNSGAVVSHLAYGRHLLEFKTINNWITPGSFYTSIQSQGVVQLIEHYYQPGSLQVIIEPAAAVSAGARWRVDSGPLQNSGATVSILNPGQYQVKFSSLANWRAPSDTNITFNRGQRITQTYQYTPLYGSITCNIVPDDAGNAGIRWRPRSQNSQWGSDLPFFRSGEIVPNVPPGTYTIDLDYRTADWWPLWSGPKTLTVSPGGQTTCSLEYQRIPRGYIAVPRGIIPQELWNSAEWRIRDRNWKSVHEAFWEFAGEYMIEFKSVDGWVTPPTQNVRVFNNQITQVIGSYRRATGSLQVFIQPEGPIRNGAKWKFTTEQNWHESGETVSELLPGQRQIEFYTAGANWITPPNQTATIVANQKATGTGIYQGVSGALTITIEPMEAAQFGARWRFGNQQWRTSGDTEPAVPVGPQKIELNTISGWTADPSPTVNVLPGQANRGTATFRRGTGSLMITIQPAEAVQAGAQWRADGGPWQNSGSTMPNVTAGSRRVEYKTIAGWTPPVTEDAVVNIGQTTTLVKNYTQQAGSLQVTLQPPNVIAAGAMWQVDGKGWRGNNQIENSVTPGQKRIEFKDVAGWAKPVVDVNVTSGQIQRATGTYTQTTGRLQVNLQPGNVESLNAQWRLDGGSWQVSRRTVSDIPAGPHQVQYSDVAGWIKPPDETVNVTAGANATVISRSYTMALGYLRVSIQPQEVMNAGKWRVDSGPWLDNNVTAPLSPGPHRVEYSNVSANYITPPPETVNITAGGTVNSVGRYTRR